MAILVNHKIAIGKPIQWSDRTRKKPVCYMLKCPWCREEQWVSVSRLYVGSDGSKNNHQCKHCGAGTEPRGGWDKRKAEPEDVFKPKCPGWRSIL